MRSCRIRPSAVRCAWRWSNRPLGNSFRSADTTRLSLTERNSARPSLLRLSGISAMPRRAARSGSPEMVLAVEDDLA